MKKYYIGVDGGGSKTSFVLMNENKEIIRSFKNGPTTFDVVSRSDFASRIEEGLKQMIPDDGEVVSIFMGLGGVTNKEDEKEIYEIVRSLNLFKETTLINSANDIYNAFYSTFENSGICIIIGTGTVTFGIDQEGNSVRLSGFGFLEGDTGSGFDIGVSALRILGKMYDGLLPFDETFKEYSFRINVSSKEDLIKIFAACNRSEIAKEAKFLIEHSSNQYIHQILSNRAKNYAIYVDSLCKQLPTISKELTIIGSCGLNENYLPLILEEINKLQPEIKYIPHRHEADYGAAYYAYKLYQNK